MISKYRYYGIEGTGHLSGINQKVIVDIWAILKRTIDLKRNSVQWERFGLVVECLTRDRGAAGSSLTVVTALCPWARTLILA